MRLLRLALKDYRGVSELELRPAPLGVTVVVGPNEIGKSSCFEALRLVFEHKDSTTKAAVREVRPIDRDVGTQIEVELESGPYHFIYRKVWFRKHATELRVLRPRPESLAGDEAHERALAILEETLDVALYRALSISQGQAQQPLDLSNQLWISQAFDRAAGASLSGAAEQSLFERARDEVELYFTATGKEGKALTAPAAEIAALEAEQSELERALKSLKEDLERTARLEAELVRDTQALERESEELRQYEERWTALASLRKELDDARAAERTANSEFQRAQADSKSRQETLAQLADQERRVREHEEHLRGHAPELEASAERRAAAFAEWERLHALARAAQTSASECADDEALVRDENDLRLLRERQDRLVKLQTELAAARAAAGDGALSLQRVEALRKLATDVAVAEASAASAAARLTLRARERLEVQIDGEARTLAPGEALEATADTRRAIAVGSQLELELRPGADAAALARSVAKSRDALAKALDELGLRDLAEAERRASSQATARAQVESLEREQAALLVDLTPQALLDKLGRLEVSVRTLRERRARGEPLPESTLAARERRERAEAARRAAETRRDQAREALVDAERRAVKVDGAQRELAAKLEAERGGLERGRGALDSARSRESDEALAARLALATRALVTASAKAEGAAEELARREPEVLGALLENKRASVKELGARQQRHREERRHVDGRLETQGESGLAEQLEASRRKLALTQDAFARTRRRAAAARLLFDTLANERARERRAYVAPLAERIEGLAQVVYGSTLRVTLSEDLAIESRTLQGVTVPFGSLSTGAKEQLGVIARLACAQIVAQDGGVPLLLDDVLGHTDPERLERMCAVLALAGKHGQVLLFTSNPERYQKIGGAKFVELARP